MSKEKVRTKAASEPNLLPVIQAKRRKAPAKMGNQFVRRLAASGGGKEASQRAQTMTTLQRRVGNHKASHLLAGPIQAKLKVGAPNDKYEQEADRVARQVTGAEPKEDEELAQTKPQIQRITPADQAEEAKRQTEPATPVGEDEEEKIQTQVDAMDTGEEEEEETVQRQVESPAQDAQEEEEKVQMQADQTAPVTEEEEEAVQPQAEGPAPEAQVPSEEEEEGPVQMKSQTYKSGSTVNPEVESTIQQARQGGQRLPESVQATMSDKFGADFSGVKIHTDDRADRLNRSLNARAFTTGQSVFFKRGEYEPGSSRGRELLAHELTHVVQQNGAVQRQVRRSPIGDWLHRPIIDSYRQWRGLPPGGRMRTPSGDEVQVGPTDAQIKYQGLQTRPLAPWQIQYNLNRLLRSRLRDLGQSLALSHWSSLINTIQSNAAYQAALRASGQLMSPSDQRQRIVAAIPTLVPVATSALQVLLTERVTRAIAIYETNRGRNQPRAVQSSLETVAGVRASVRSVGQTIIARAITELRRFPQLRQLVNPNLTLRELNQADNRIRAVNQLLRRVSGAGQHANINQFIRNNQNLINNSGLTQAHVRTMFQALTLHQRTQQLHNQLAGLTPAQQRARARQLAAGIPVANRLGIGVGSLAAYIRNPGNWNENRAAWARLAVERMPNRIGQRIVQAAEHNQGLTMLSMDLGSQVRNLLARNPGRTLQSMVESVARRHNAGRHYPAGVWREYQRLNPN